MFGKFNLFKNKVILWRVVFKDHKGIMQAVTVKADSRTQVLNEMKRIFKKSDVIDMIQI